MRFRRGETGGIAFYHEGLDWRYWLVDLRGLGRWQGGHTAEFGEHVCEEKTAGSGADDEDRNGLGVCDGHSWFFFSFLFFFN